MRIYIDLDDTIFDFKGAFRHNKDNCEFPQSKYGFFLNLKPLPQAVEGVRFLMGKHDVWFATRPSIYNPMSYTEKRVSIENTFGFDVCNKLILIPDKGLLKADPDDYLIDDMAWPEFGGKQILFGKDPEFMNWEQVVKYFS